MAFKEELMGFKTESMVLEMVGKDGKNPVGITETGPKTANNRLHKGPQKAGGLGNNGFIIERTSSKIRIPFVACEAERWAHRGNDR